MRTSDLTSSKEVQRLVKRSSKLETREERSSTSDATLDTSDLTCEEGKAGEGMEGGENAREGGEEINSRKSVLSSSLLLNNFFYVSLIPEALVY